MSNSIIGAGAGPGPGSASSSTTPSSNTSTVERKLRKPTEKEEEEIQEILNLFTSTDILYDETLWNDENLKVLEKFLEEHPDLDVNNVYSDYEPGITINSYDKYVHKTSFPLRMNLYGMLMLSPIIDINNPLLQEIIRRKPHPEIVSIFRDYYDGYTDKAKKTLEDFLTEEIDKKESDLLEFINENRPQEQIDRAIKEGEKELNILRTKLKYIQNIERVGQQGRILSAVMRSGLRQKIPENAIGLIGSYLIEKKGPPRSQMNQLRQNVGLSSLLPKKQNTKKGGKRKEKKSYKRRNMRQKSNKTRK